MPAVSSAARPTSLAARAGDSSREVAEPNGSVPRTPSATTATIASVAAATAGRQGTPNRRSNVAAARPSMAIGITRSSRTNTSTTHAT